MYLVEYGFFADKDEEYKTTPEKVYTANDPEEKFGWCETVGHFRVVAMNKIVDPFEYPQNPHHSKQLCVQQLEFKYIYSVRLNLTNSERIIKQESALVVLI